MISRLIVVIIGIPLVYLFLSYNIYSRLLLFLLVSTVSQLEFYKILSNTCKFEIGKINLEIIGGNSILIFASFCGLNGLALSFFLLQVLLGVNIVLYGLNYTGTQRFCIGNAGILYIPCNLAFYILISNEFDVFTLLGIILSIWSLDIGAYTVGMPIRGPRLAPLISPNKTVSGCIGGILFTFMAVFLCNYFGLLNFSTNKLILLALTISSIGQISDLFESILKREANVKDSSKILGEHGGMLDRIDSLLFLGPISYFVVRFL